jgi:hypothetical protein
MQIVRRELLDRVPRALLVRILAPFEEFFGARGLSLAELGATEQTDRRLVRRVHDILHADVAVVPRDLRHSLGALDALANASGQAALFALCPSLLSARRGPEETAAVALLDHPEAFAQAKRVGTDGGGGLSFSDFDAVSPRAPALSRGAYEAFGAAIRAWMVAHGRTEFFALHVADHAGSVHLEIEHGRPPATDDVVGAALELTQVTAVRTERAVVVLDRARARASIHASHAAIKELFRATIGECFYGSRDHFLSTGTYTLAPLTEDLDAALAFDDVPGLLALTLLGLTLRTADERITRESLGRLDLRAAARARELRDALASGATVESCKLRITFAGRARPSVVELSPSRRKVGNLGAELVRLLDEWMLSRGLLVLAARRVRPAELAPQPLAAETA